MDQIEDVDLASMPAYVRERWPVAYERAMRKISAAAPDVNTPRLIKAAQQASNASQRVIWLHRAASAWSTPLMPVAACRQGCAHCCHIPVTISSIEADLIGRRVGHRPARPAQSVQLQEFEDLEDAVPALEAISASREPSPCPFLLDGACSVYDVRPMACRLLVNLDDDDLLCRLVPGQAIPVPYANSQQLKGLFVLAQLAAPLADIRDFFPVAHVS
jgi:Fe-S-cluster containining protein